MEHQIFTFINNHLFLVGLFALLLVAIVVYELKNGQGSVGGIPHLAPQQAVMHINHNHALIVDVRSQDAFNSGHILDAINIPATDLEQQLKKIEKYKKKPVVVVCALGQSAAKVAKQLLNAGFQDVRVLMGGLQEWQKSRLPLVKS